MTEEIITIFKAEVDGFKADLQKVKNELRQVNDLQKKSADEVKKNFSTASQAVTSNLGSLKSNILGVGAAIGVSFTVGAVIEFGKEVVKLSLQAEGVRNAFERLNNPKLLEHLRVATKGTVSDLELMKAAVNANNFQIPLDQLGKLLAFAQQRAKDTGQSVDYLVNSIVTGIARKSLPILDNLGLNTMRVREEFEKTGDMASAVGNIIDVEMTKAGNSLLTSAEKLEILDAGWQNLKVSIGDVVTEFLLALPGIQEVTNALQVQSLIQQELQNKRMNYYSDLNKLTQKQLDLERIQIENNITLLKSYEDLNSTMEQENNAQIQIEQEKLEMIKKVSAERNNSALQQLQLTQKQLSYQKLSLEELTKMAEEGDVLAKKEIQNREKSTKAWEEHQKKVKERQDELLKQQQMFNDAIEDYDKSSMEMRLQAARDFQDSLREMSDEQLQYLLDNQEIPDTLFYEIMDERIAAETQMEQERLQRIRENQERELEIKRQTAEAEIALEQEVFNAFRQFSNLASDLFKDNAGMQSLFFAYEKVLAIAQIITQLQIEKAKNAAANAALGAAGVPITLAQNQTANIRAGVSIATIVAQTIPQLRLAKGTKDVKGGVEGRDSVSALLMPHEMVFPVKTSKKYKPILNAIFDERISAPMLNKIADNMSSGKNGFADNIHQSMIVKASLNSNDMAYAYKIGGRDMLNELKEIKSALKQGVGYKVKQRKQW